MLVTPLFWKEGRETFSYGPLRKCIPVIFHKELAHSRVSEGRPYFGDVGGHGGLHCWVHTQHGGAVLNPLVLRDEEVSRVALANPGGLVVRQEDVI